MSLIWNENGVVTDDRWQVGEGEGPFLGLEEALQAAENGTNEIAVQIEPGDNVAELEPILDRLAIVSVNFPAFSDGRGFSHANLLRDRMGFAGEIRARGSVLLDQVPFMLRVGFTSVETEHSPTADRLSQMRLPGISLHYQPSVTKTRVEGGYSWRRRTVAPG